MGEEKKEEQWRRADEAVLKNLPPGVKLVRTLRGHTDFIGRIAWSPNGRMLASPSKDRTIRVWDADTGECLRTIERKTAELSVAFNPKGQALAMGANSGIEMRDISNGKLLCEFGQNLSPSVSSLAFDSLGRRLLCGYSLERGTQKYSRTRIAIELWDVVSAKRLVSFKDYSKWARAVINPMGTQIASGGDEDEVKLWDIKSGRLLRKFKGHKGIVNSVTFNADGSILASAGNDKTVKFWNVASGKMLNSLEGHTSYVSCVAFMFDGRILASKSCDGTIRLWDSNTRACVAEVVEEALENCWGPGVAFHPHLPLLATVGSDPGTEKRTRDRVIHIWELDSTILLSQCLTSPAVTYTSAKVVLVGDSGVGKTGLGWRLAHGEFKEHSSTHGQQFWLLNQLCKQRRDGAQCEAVLWDLAGQDDYRLIHALFLDDADLALVLFDPTRNDDPLSGVEYWLKQLKVGRRDVAGIPTVLVAARSDRGTPRLTQKEMKEFCRKRGIKVYLPTSAKAGEGIEELIRKMQGLILWDDKPATVTTETFKQIKDFVLEFKENPRRRKVILTQEELRARLEAKDSKWEFTDGEMLTAVGHLANHGYVTRLETSQGEPRILLAPELLNNLAASFVLEARKSRKGLGSIEEERLRSGDYKFSELHKLNENEKSVLLDAATVLFLEHNVCFRETDPLNGRAYLVFPELINLKKPIVEEECPTENGVAYTVSGSVENVYASLVVLLGYTQTFTRTNQWRNQARYEVGQGFVCGFRQEEERAGELDFVLYFCAKTPVAVRTLFQSLFESFLARRNLTVRRFEPIMCSKGHPLNRSVMREQMAREAKFAFCNQCGEKIAFPKADKPIQLTRHQAEQVEADRMAADQRSRFEQVLFRLKTHTVEQKIKTPECFISYAWGNPDHEQWVERSLAADLQKAGITVVLDRWENARIGASVPRFVERVEKADRVIVVGSPLYRNKYDNKEPMRGFVAAAEGDLIGKRMIGSEARKETVLPVLLDGTEESALPPLLQGRVYADFRKSECYFDVALGLLLSLYGIQPTQPVAIELTDSLKGSRG